ncbi:hypothetical protein RhiJN_22390 [Ceratobasidium sp. AG-Ba]|nr:hypothetical protein RhiJN_22390 [Ceratobasidium sp. AG-Ba]
MSQTLVAIANNQPVSPPVQHQTADSAFSPPRSAVIVNILWLLSLSLSVAVLLIAIMAKEWCYNFMSNRAGPIYEQARRRQERWDGIRRWRMQEVVALLRWMMHTALFLFAVGLCIYLWDIHIGVAIPVTAVTALGICLYGLITILPLFDKFCPYSTPVTPLALAPVKVSKKVFYRLRTSIEAWCRAIYDHGIYLCSKTDRKTWRELTLKRVLDFLHPVAEISQENAALSASRDLVTSRILAWMIMQCEDSRSVDVALCVIGGAQVELNCEPFAEQNALSLVCARLDTSTLFYHRSGTDHREKKEALLDMHKYSRAYIMVLCGRISTAPGSSALSRKSLLEEINQGLMTHKDLYEELAQFWSERQAQTTSAPLLLYRWRWNSILSTLGFNAQYSLAGHQLDLERTTPYECDPPETISYFLCQNSKWNNEFLSAPRLLVLLQYSAHYLIHHWPKEEPQRRRKCPLPRILIEIFLTPRCTAPDITRMIAATLAAAALAIDEHRKATWFVNRSPLEGVIQALELSQTDRLSKDATRDLFLFGAIGTLPDISLQFDGSRAPDIGSKFYESISKAIGGRIKPGRKFPIIYAPKDAVPCSKKLLSQEVLEEQAIQAARQILISVGNQSLSLEDEAMATDFCSTLFDKPLHISRPYNEALFALARAKSEDLRLICTKLIVTGVLPRLPLQHIGQSEGDSTLSILCSILPDTHLSVACFVLSHLRLVLTDIILCPLYTLEQRRAALRPLLDSYPRASSLEPSAPISKPLTVDIIASHVTSNDPAEHIANGLRQTMQLISDFCNSDLSPDFPAEMRSEDHTDIEKWRERREKLQDSIKGRAMSTGPTSLEKPSPPFVLASDTNNGSTMGTSERLSDKSSV